jgi:hypothetical protein
VTLHVCGLPDMVLHMLVFVTVLCSRCSQEAPKPNVDADRAALMRRIAALAVAEDEAVLQQMQGQPGGQQDAQGADAPAKPEVLQTPALKVRIIRGSVAHWMPGCSG